MAARPFNAAIRAQSAAVSDETSAPTFPTATSSPSTNGSCPDCRPDPGPHRRHVRGLRRRHRREGQAKPASRAVARLTRRLRSESGASGRRPGFPGSDRARPARAPNRLPPVVEDLLGRVHEQRHGHVLPLVMVTGYLYVRSAAPASLACGRGRSGARSSGSAEAERMAAGIQKNSESRLISPPCARLAPRDSAICAAATGSSTLRSRWNCCGPHRSARWDD